MRIGVHTLVPLLATLAMGCTSGANGAAQAAPGCRIVQPSAPLPPGLDETSGVAASREHEGVLWTHNDSGGDPVVHALDQAGRLLGSVRLGGARARDWEDIASGPCSAGSCLFVGDIGDNNGKREEVTIYRVPEPRPGDRASARVDALPVRYPGGPRDAEALFVLPDGGLYIVSKGRNSSVALFRYPMPLRPGETVTLEEVATLAEGVQPIRDQVTGASASPSGEWVAIRTYRALFRFRSADLVAGRVTPVETLNLEPVGEAQGEAVALLDDERVVLTSEGGFRDAPGTLAVLRCTVPSGAAEGG